MIEDTITDMMDAVVAWLYDVLLYLARVLLFMLPPDFTSLSITAMQEGIFFGDGFKTLVFACYAIIIVVGGFLVMSHETLQTRYSVREIVPRLAIGMLLVGVVWTIVPKTVLVNNDIVAAFVAVDIEVPDGVCTDPGYRYEEDGLEGCDWEEDVEISKFAYWTLYTPAAGQEIGLFHIFMIIISIVCLLVLVVTWVMRFIALFMVVGLAPLALACHGLPITEQFAHLWWRMLGACMASSIGQAGLIWMWHDLRELFLDHEDNLLGYSFITEQAYFVVLVWMMWKVHTESFRIARGRPVKVPGSRLLAGFVMSKVADLGGKKPKRKISTPGTIWGTDMTRPPWRRKAPEGEGAAAKQTPSGGNGGGQGGAAPSGPAPGGPVTGPNGGGAAGGGAPVAPEKPASPHDQRVSTGKSAPTVGGRTAEPAPEAGTDLEVPPWKRPHPAVADGGFDPEVAAVSLRGQSGNSGSAPAKPGAPTATPVPGKPKPAPSKPRSGPPKPAPAPARPTAADRSSTDGALPQAASPEAAGPAPHTARAPVGSDGRPDPRSFASFEDYQASCPQGGAACRGCGGTCEFGKYWHRFHPREGK